jgi:TolB-like protein/DNA-binding winged helix-turn-helix (wHTH) protein/tetratricopeptide (TPR) repeat protein
MSAQRRPGSWQIGDWVADPADDTLSRGAEVSKLEPRMMRLLLRLAEHPGAVVSQDQLLIEVWAGVIVGSASVYQAVSQLRKVLGDTGEKPTYIETVARKGYRLIAPVQAPGSEVSPPADAPPAKRMAFGWFIGIAVVAVVGVAVAAGLLWRHRLRSGPEATSIAVLPFVDLTDGKTQQPFCDGVTEELSSWLSQIPNLRVVARSSAFAFRDKQTDAREIGRVLGTTHVLEGTLRMAGSAIRVTVQLIGTRDGYNVWSGSYDTVSRDLIHVQEEVARAVADSLEVRLTNTALLSLAQRDSTKEHAYSLYLVARHHQQQRTKRDNDRAIELYKEALAADPDFALALTALASAYLNQQRFDDRRIEEIAEDMRPLLARAEALAPRLPELYVTRGAMESDLLQTGAALRDLQHALALNPGSRDAESELGNHHLLEGEPIEALQHYDRAALLDPLDYYLQAQRCRTLSDLAQFDSASAACERSRQLNPNAGTAYNVSSSMEEARGRIIEALRWNAQEFAHDPDVRQTYATRGSLLVSLGLPELARESFQAAMTAVGDARTSDSMAWLDLLTLYAHGGAPAVRARIRAAGLDSKQEPHLLFEVASVELMDGDTQAARALVDRALASPELTPRDLANAWQARLGHSYLLIAAAAHRMTGDAAGAEVLLTQASKLLERLSLAGVHRYGVFELKAQIAALRGQTGEAVQLLQRATDLGWREAWLAEHEPYFGPIRANADYRALIERVQAENTRDSRALDSALTLPPKPTS